MRKVILSLFVVYALFSFNSCYADNELYQIDRMKWYYLGEYEKCVKGYINLNDYTYKTDEYKAESDCEILLVYHVNNVQQLILEQRVNVKMSLIKPYDIRYKNKTTWAKAAAGGEASNEEPDVYTAVKPFSIYEEVYLDAFLFMNANRK